MYIVHICEEAARKKHVRNLYLSSMNAGHHKDDIICTKSNDINSGNISGIDNIAANIVKCDIIHMGKRYFDLGLNFKSVNAYHEDAFGFGIHVIPSQR